MSAPLTGRPYVYAGWVQWASYLPALYQVCGWSAGAQARMPPVYALARRGAEPSALSLSGRPSARSRLHSPFPGGHQPAAVCTLPFRAAISPQALQHPHAIRAIRSHFLGAPTDRTRLVLTARAVAACDPSAGGAPVRLPPLPLVLSATPAAPDPRASRRTRRRPLPVRRGASRAALGAARCD
eukprot:4163407-Prymnesium_polylepis.1